MVIQTKGAMPSMESCEFQIVPGNVLQEPQRTGCFCGVNAGHQRAVPQKRLGDFVLHIAMGHLGLGRSRDPSGNQTHECMGPACFFHIGPGVLLLVTMPSAPSMFLQCMLGWFFSGFDGVDRSMSLLFLLPQTHRLTLLSNTRAPQVPHGQ